MIPKTTRSGLASTTAGRRVGPTSIAPLKGIDRRIRPLLSAHYIPDGHYVFYRPEIQRLHDELAAHLSGPLPVHLWGFKGAVIHGPFGTGKTEFTHNLASRLADQGKPVNLFVINEVFLGDNPLMAVQELFIKAEDAAQKTGRRSVIVWEDPEARMAHIYTEQIRTFETSQTSRSAASVTERVMAPGREDAVRLTSLVANILEGRMPPLANTCLILVTNHLDALDPAIFSSNRLKAFEFGLIYRFREELRDVYLRSLASLFPVINAQLMRLAEFDKDLKIEGLSRHFAVLAELFNSTIDQILRQIAADKNAGLRAFNRYAGQSIKGTVPEIPDETALDGAEFVRASQAFRAKAEAEGLYLPISFNPNLFSTPRQIRKALNAIMVHIPADVKRNWGMEQTKALISYLYCISATFPTPGASLKQVKSQGGHYYVTDPLGFSLPDMQDKLIAALYS